VVVPDGMYPDARYEFEGSSEDTTGNSTLAGFWRPGVTAQKILIAEGGS